MAKLRSVFRAEVSYHFSRRSVRYHQIAGHYPPESDWWCINRVVECQSITLELRWIERDWRQKVVLRMRLIRQTLPSNWSVDDAQRRHNWNSKCVLLFRIESRVAFHGRVGIESARRIIWWNKRIDVGAINTLQPMRSNPKPDEEEGISAHSWVADRWMSPASDNVNWRDRPDENVYFIHKRGEGGRLLSNWFDSIWNGGIQPISIRLETLLKLRRQTKNSGRDGGREGGREGGETSRRYRLTCRSSSVNIHNDRKRNGQKWARQ